MIERLRVRVPAGTAGEFSSPWSTFCADSFFLSFFFLGGGGRVVRGGGGGIHPPWYHSSTYKIPVILPKNAGGRLQLYTHEPSKPVHGCMEVYTKRAPIRQQFLVAPAT